MKWANLTGLEIAQGIMDGSIPADDPMAVSLNFSIVEVEKNRCVFEGTPLAAHQNIALKTHGGWPMAILDSAVVIAVLTALPKGRLCTTSTFEMKFHRPLKMDQRYRAEGVLMTLGRTLGHGQGILKDTQTGKIVASCTCTCSVTNVLDD